MNKLKQTAQQHKNYMLTINNPEKYGYDHQKIFDITRENFPTISYIALVDEKGSTYHTHGLFCFNSRVRFRTVKKHFPEAHIEPVKGRVSDCIVYLKKDGKWLDDEKKQEQRIEGTFEEWGEPPLEKTRKRNYYELYTMIKDGYTNAEIIAENQDFIPMLDMMDRVRTTVLYDIYKDTRRLDLKVTYVFGVTGAGKTKDILDRYGDSQVYRVTDYKNSFDHYACQPVITFEEFRSSLKISDMLNYCDIYPLELPARYSNKFACYKEVFITSNWSLESQYNDIQFQSQETWRAFLRRIHYVLEYKKDGVLGWTTKNYLDKRTRAATALMFTTDDIINSNWMEMLDMASAILEKPPTKSVSWECEDIVKEFEKIVEEVHKNDNDSEPQSFPKPGEA